MLWQSQWSQHHQATIVAPDVYTTCKGSREVIDFCVISTVLQSIFMPIETVDVPWGPHIGLRLKVQANPNKVLVRRLVEPLPLRMEIFTSKWKNTSVNLQRSHIRTSTYLAHSMLAQHSHQESSPAILGQPSQVLTADYKFSLDMEQHVLVGEVLARVSLQTELLVCAVSGIKFAK